VSAQTSGDHDNLRCLLGSQTLSPLTDGIRITVGPTRDFPGGAAPFLVPQAGRLIVAPSSLAGPAAAVHLRHGLELAWLLGQALPPPVAGLLAARTAALFLAFESPAARKLCQAEPALDLLPALAESFPHRAILAASWRQLSHYQTPPAVAIEPGMLERTAALWRVAGPVEHLLTTGGDPRLDLDRDSGRNRYGTAPRPRDGVISFASCTASSVSADGYRAAEACRRRVLSHGFSRSITAALDDEAQSIRAAILDHYGATDLAEAILAPSGTDAALLLMGLLTADSPAARITNLLVNPTETGSGVPAAICGQHFAQSTAGGRAVAKGASVAGFPASMQVASIALRGPDASPLPIAAVDRCFATEAAEAAGAGRAVLHLMDGSKTGLSAPSLGMAERLAGRHAGSLDVVVDACQARIEAPQIRRYLELGWPVLLTGSKFFGGPCFSGAILFPRARLEPALRSVPSGLADYVGGDAAGLLGLGDNFGLALRWAAALAEMQAFAAVPPDVFGAVLDRIGARVRNLFRSNHRVRLVPAPRPAAPGWSGRQSVFTLMLRDPANPALWLAPSALEKVCSWMNSDVAALLPAHGRNLARQPYHLGQPVLVGRSPSGPIGAVRIAFGAQLGHLVAASPRPDAAIAATVAQLEACAAKLSLVLDGFSELTASAA
jgi:hypothetical protein